MAPSRCCSAASPVSALTRHRTREGESAPRPLASLRLVRLVTGDDSARHRRAGAPGLALGEVLHLPAQ